MIKFLNTLRWIWVGFLLGATTMCYLISEGEKVEKKPKHNHPDNVFSDCEACWEEEVKQGVK